ncbi:MAG TPA: precorrin-2 C(20)-methyltransferase [bacterium]|jgi:precorrin-2/cobalt-factor-2 C20-methyltransferase|nr:precorrin-2 C(20)-methyltransferase [bacterium]
MSALGTFYGVGIGPGDPELLTTQALRVLSGVEVIFVPKAKITDEGLALGIVLKALTKGPAMGKKAELRELVFPMSKDPEVLRPAWEAARAAVLEVLRQGTDCAFITLGDTAIYSTYMNLLDALRKTEPGLRIVTAPGISSFSQAAAGLNLSLVEKAEKMAVLPCLSDVEGMRADLERFDCVVLMKVGRRFGALRELLRGMGLLAHSHLALKLGTPDEILTSDLDAVDPEKVTYMSLVIVRKPLKAGYDE